MAKLRVAVVGAAGTWGRYYLGAYAAHPEVELVALVDSAERVARATGGARAMRAAA